MCGREEDGAGTRCLYPGCLGLADGSECRHPDMVIRPDECKHPSISDEMLLDREAEIQKTWGNAQSYKCLDCDEYLYPHEGVDGWIVYVGEPWGAGHD